MTTETPFPVLPLAQGAVSYLGAATLPPVVAFVCWIAFCVVMLSIATQAAAGAATAANAAWRQWREPPDG